MDCKLLVNKLKSTGDLVNGKIMDQQTLKNLHSNGIHVRNFETVAAETMNQCNINDMDNSQKHNFLLFHQLNSLQPYALNRFPPIETMHFVNDTQNLQNTQNTSQPKDFQNAHNNLDENRSRKLGTSEDCMPPGNLRVSPTLSETSTNKNSNWSAEEQFKQVRQLYEINDDPKRKEFLDELFSFMQKRGTPISRLPIMAKSVLDLYELYNLVIARGGLVDVINKKLWQEIIKGLHLPSSITSAAFTLRTQYMRFLYPYECEKKNLSTPAELQAAVDSNRREGRRSNYYQSPADGPLYVNTLQQMSPFMNPNLTQMHGMPKPIVEERLMQYLNLRQAIDEYYLARSAAAPPTAPRLPTPTATPALTPTVPAQNIMAPAPIEDCHATHDASNQALDLSKISRSPSKRNSSTDEQQTDAPPLKRTAIENMPPFLHMPACDKNLNQSERVEAFLNFIKAWQESQLQLIHGS